MPTDRATPRPKPLSEQQPPPTTAAREQALRDLFPEAVTEGKIDFDKLRQLHGEGAAGSERYQFSWAGRADAIDVLRTPSRATLIPDPDHSLNFDTTANAIVEGDNLEVLKLLARGYAGRVKLIYIDPPYNTGNDFVYPDDFRDPLAVYLRMTNQTDDAGNLLTSNPDTGGRYHSAWLSMMYPRLFLARQLLRDDGVLCVSIDDHEVHHLRMIINEVFGEENFVATCIWQKVYAPKNSAKHFSEDHDYILVYARSAADWRPTLLARSEEANASYSNPDNDPRGDWRADGMSARNYYAAGQYEAIGPSGRKHLPPRGRYWAVNEKRFKELDADGRIWWGNDGNGIPANKTFLSEVRQGMTPQTMWFYKDVGHTQEAKKELIEFVPYQDTDNVIDTVKPTRLLRRVLQLCTTPDGGDIVVDFFAGSGSTAHAVLDQNRDDGGNRQFLLVQLPEPLPAPEAELKKLSDVSQARVRNVVAKLNAAAGDLTRTTPEDLGFKLFRLAESHLKAWAGSPERTAAGYQKALSLFAENTLRDDWTPAGLLWELALREGYSLNATLAEVPGTAQTWRVSDPDKSPPQSFLAVLSATLPHDLTTRLNLTADDLLYVRDSALDDTLAANLSLQCRLKTI